MVPLDRSHDTDDQAEFHTRLEQSIITALEQEVDPRGSWTIGNPYSPETSYTVEITEVTDR